MSEAEREQAAGPRLLDGIDALRELVGTTLGQSGWLEVDQARIDAFAEATGDRQWIHVDPARAADGPFGTTIAHGYLTLSLLPLLVAEVYRVTGVGAAVNYGSDRVRFPAPLPSGSRVRATVELIAVEDASGGARVRTRETVERDGGGKPVLVAEPITLLVAAA